MDQLFDKSKPYLDTKSKTAPTDRPKAVKPFPGPCVGVSDTMISDFSDPRFQAAFQQYFDELEVSVSDWPALFHEMNEDGENSAFIRMDASGNVIGFILFKPEHLKSWFFEETCGFIREFWVAEQHRNVGHGSALLRLAEEYFLKQGIFTCILTTDSAKAFYLNHGYVKAPGCKAKNKDDVFIKQLN